MLRRLPDIDLLRVRDARRIGRSDAEILDWAAAEERVLVTHDARTVPSAAAARVRTGLRMPGEIVIDDLAGARAVIDDVMLLAELGTPDDLRDCVVFVPLRS